MNPFFLSYTRLLSSLDFLAQQRTSSILSWNKPLEVTVIAFIYLFSFFRGLLETVGSGKRFFLKGKGNLFDIFDKRN